MFAALRTSRMAPCLQRTATDCRMRRYETGFDGFSGANFTTAAQDTAFANTTELQRLATLIANGKNGGGNAVVIGEWGLAGERVIRTLECKMMTPGLLVSRSYAQACLRRQHNSPRYPLARGFWHSPPARVLPPSRHLCHGDVISTLRMRGGRAGHLRVSCKQNSVRCLPPVAAAVPAEHCCRATHCSTSSSSGDR